MSKPIVVAMNQPVPDEPGIYLYIDSRGVTHLADIVRRDGELRMMMNHQFNIHSPLAREVSWSKRLSFAD